MQSLVVGDPMKLETEIGPLAMRQLADEVDAQVTKSVAQGARILTGGRPLGGPGYFYPPSILTDIPKGSPADCEEVFGPVALLHRVESLDQGLAVANDTPFGLGACIWTQDPAEQARAAEELEAGIVFVNGMVAIRSTPAVWRREGVRLWPRAE